MKAISLILLAGVCHADPVYQLHEWGTFTTVSGSDGVLLAGLQREEEQLPDFVHSHLGMENGQQPDQKELQRIYRLHGTLGFIPPGSKGVGKRPLAGVTVKMETPVIYFHSREDSPFRAKVKVGFHGGTISQWYPQRSGGERLPEPAPAPNPRISPTRFSAWTLDFAKAPYEGGIEWDVEVMTPEATRDTVLFKPGDNLGWLRARQAEANAVKATNGETEGYLFYRGLGHFDPGLKTIVTRDGSLTLSNNTGGKIPYFLVFERENGRVRWADSSEGLDAGGKTSIPEAALKDGPAGFAEPIYRAMKAGLANCGLTDAEARGMVETWWSSYFEASGLRVFWVLPRETTDRLLPLEVSPPPEKIVRVLVGRSEILRPRREKELLAAALKKGEEARTWNYLVNADRFGLAIRERVKALGVANPEREVQSAPEHDSPAPLNLTEALVRSVGLEPRKPESP